MNRTKSGLAVAWVSFCFSHAAAQSPAASHAQTYPTRPIRLVVAQSIGGNADFVSRNYALRLGDFAPISPETDRYSKLIKAIGLKL